MRIMKYSLGHGLFCAVEIYELHLESGRIYCCIIAVSIGSAMRGEKNSVSTAMAAASSQENTVMAIVSARREVVVVGYAMAAALVAVSSRRE